MTIKQADRLTKCNCCGAMIQVGEKIKFKEITRSAGRTNGGYGTAKTIKTGAFVVTCYSCLDRSKLEKAQQMLKIEQDDLQSLPSDAPQAWIDVILANIEFYKKQIEELKSYV